MADIARLANVSISTVSRALSDHPSLSEATRRRVVEIAQAMHYEVDAGAQMLRGKALRTIAIGFPFHAQERRHFSDPFFLAQIGALGDALVDRGHSMLIVPVQGDAIETALRPYETRQAAGTLLLGQEHYHARIEAIAARGVPLVVWGARMRQQRYCSVGSDNVEGGRQATAHLLACGARRIAFFGDPSLPEITERHQGYLAAHGEAGLPVDPRLVRPVPFVAPPVHAAFDRLRAEGPAFDAVFAVSDLIATAVIGAARAQGLQVPADLQVVGFDDTLLAAHANPPLTTVRQQIELASQLMVDKLFAQLRGEAVESALLPTTLVVRGSTRAPTSVP